MGGTVYRGWDSGSGIGTIYRQEVNRRTGKIRVGRSLRAAGQARAERTSFALRSSSFDGWRRIGPSSAAPPGGIRQHEQVQAGDQEQDEREQRQEAHPDGGLLLAQSDDVDDDA